MPSARHSAASSAICSTAPSADSSGQLVIQALAARRATPAELDEIRRLLADHDDHPEEKDHD